MADVDSLSLEEVRAERARLQQQLDQRGGNNAMRDMALDNGGQGVSVADLRRERARLSAMLREREAGRRRANPTQDEARAVAESAAYRQTQRNIMPFGLGHVTQPIVNTITDPDRRAALVDSVRSFADDVREAPRLDFRRLGQDTGRALVDGILNLPETAKNIVTHLPEIARAATFGPFVDEEARQRDLDLARVQGDTARTGEMAQEANAQTAAAATNVAGVAAAPVAATPLRAAGLTATLTAPHAFAGDEPLQERIPEGIATTTGAAAFGGGAQALANAAPQALAPTRRLGRETTAQRTARFDEAGVRPTTAAVTGGESGGGLTNMIRENWIAGGRARSNLQRSLDDTAAAASRLTQEAGEPLARETAGEMVQQGVRRWARDADAPLPAGETPASVTARDWSFAAKARALYEPIFKALEADEVAQVQGRLRTVTIDATQQALEAIAGRTHGSAVSELVQSPLVQKIADAIERDTAGAAPSMRFKDLRALRTFVREAQADPALRQGLDNAALQHIEAALTEDIYRSADMIGGVAAEQLRRVDQYYRAGMQRIDNALEAFTSREPARAYDRIIDLARDQGGTNTRALAQLRSTLRPDEWRQVQATIIDRLGKVRPGQSQSVVEEGFSVANFSSNFEKLSARGRATLFTQADGNPHLLNALENLAEVAKMQQGVERMANHSRSGVTMQNVGTVGALVNPTTTVPAVAGLVLAGVTGEMLTNPIFVRWLSSAARPGQTLGGLRQALAQLSALASRDPALAPAYAELAARLDEAEQQEQAAPAN